MLSIWPPFAIIGLVVCALSMRQFSFLDTAPAAHQHRSNSIDGLRGILASGVFFHHFVWLGYDLKNRVTGLPPSNFYAFIGPGSVSVFFMITGYLFWGRLVDRKGSIQWGDFYVNRLFRIAPLYLFLIAAYFAFVIIRSGLPANLTIETATQVSKWLALGAVDHPTPFLDHPEYLGIVGQTWSLHYEWLFYLALPLIAVLAREKSAIAVIGATLLFFLFGAAIINQPYRSFVENFLLGMLTASLLRSFRGFGKGGILWSVFALAAGATALALPGDPFTDTRSIMLGLFFFFIASGATAFGALLTPGARRLGNISYSIYLLHGLVIVTLMQFPRFGANMTYSVGRFWLVTLITYVVVIALSAATYYLIERRGIDLGRRVLRWKSANAQLARTT
jgi:peptidoglycan/LPS O-acetylase OafA/YrhL